MIASNLLVQIEDLVLHNTIDNAEETLNFGLDEDIDEYDDDDEEEFDAEGEDTLSSQGSSQGWDSLELNKNEKFTHEQVKKII